MVDEQNYRVAVIVPVHNRRETTLGFLRQMEEIDRAGASLEIIIVDDGSTDGTAEAIGRDYPGVIILQGSGNLWWTGAINTGVRYALSHEFDYFLITNDDLELAPDFLAGLLEVARNRPDALVSAVTLNAEAGYRAEILTAGFVRRGRYLDVVTLHAGDTYTEETLPEAIECDMLTGAALLLPPRVFEVVGLLDEKHFPHNWGDFEFTLRASLAGFHCLVATRSRVYTDYNRRYPIIYFYSSSRREFLKNLFDSRRHYYGFGPIRATSFMHRRYPIALILYARRLAGLLKTILIKLLFPKPLLRRHLLRAFRSRNVSRYLIEMLEAER